MSYPQQPEQSTVSQSSTQPASSKADQLVKRSRRSNPKVKTGCTNCKQRRIKCDEKRPACTQCVRSGRSCTGYPPPSRSSHLAMETRIAPKPLTINTQPAPLASTPSVVPTAGISMLRKEIILPPRRAARRRTNPGVNKALPRRITPPIFQQPSTLPFQPVENRYFHSFRLNTASQLSGYFNSDFWTQRVLQECHNQDAIRHSVVALGALYKTLEQAFESRQPNMVATKQNVESVMSHWQIAIKQYSDACNAMLSIKGDTAQDYRTRLTAIILLSCFDSFIGDHKQAIIQIQTGLGLLEKLQAHWSSKCHVPSELPKEDDLVSLFDRLAIQAKSYDLAFHFPEPYVIKLSGSSTGRQLYSPDSERSFLPFEGTRPVKDAFHTLAEARLASDRLCITLLVFIEKLHAAKSDPSYVLPPSWKMYGMGLKDHLDAWSKAFEPLFASRIRPETPHIERAGISALKMFQINTNVIFFSLFCDNEMQFDSYMPHFKMIVDLGWEVVHTEQDRAKKQENRDALGRQQSYPQSAKGASKAEEAISGRLKPSFAADLGIVPPLYVVATKCRDPWLRRQAIQLLKSSARREGMWDSELTANIATWIMQLEEQGAPSGSDTARPAPFDARSSTSGAGFGPVDTRGGVLQWPIPEDRRIMLKAVDFDLRARYADMTVGNRAVYNGALDVRLRKTRIAW